jgi:uncharacterized RDD family membrane protein YckC
MFTGADPVTAPSFGRLSAEAAADVLVRVSRMYPMAPPSPRGPYPAAPAGTAAWGRGVPATVGVGRDDLVSGEAVALDLPAASLGLRIASGLIDFVVGMAVLIFLLWLSFKLATDEALFGACATMSVMLAWAALPTIVETTTRGKTLGHLALGLRTVRDDAGPIQFRHALTRAMLGVVEIYTFFGVPALIASAISRKNKRLGDMVAGTYVIRDRFRFQMPDPVGMPPMLEPWARTADLSSIPDSTAISLRLFLTRAEQYTPAARRALSDRLIIAVAPYVAPAPPSGAPYELVLAAILAERRRRDAERLAREERLRRNLLR